MNRPQNTYLTTEEFIDLRRRALKGDTLAGNVLINRYERLVCALVRRFLLTHTPHTPSSIEDLMQVGRMGLWEAITRYNPEIPSKPSTFLSTGIQFALKSALEENTLLPVRVPRHVLALGRKIRSICAVFRETHGYHPYAQEIQEELGKTGTPPTTNSIILAQQLSAYQKPIPLDVCEDRIWLPTGSSEERGPTGMNKAIEQAAEDACLLLKVLYKPSRAETLQRLFGLILNEPQITTTDVQRIEQFNRQRMSDVWKHLHDWLTRIGLSITDLLWIRPAYNTYVTRTSDVEPLVPFPPQTKLPPPSFVDERGAMNYEAFSAMLDHLSRWSRIPKKHWPKPKKS